MSALVELIEKGGPVMLTIIALSVILYSRCFKLLLGLRRARARMAAAAANAGEHLHELRDLRDDVQDSFRQQRVVLSAMIAAAPLLGLLGTVSGMTSTFQNLAGQRGEDSMEGLARGIAEVLIATESGLTVAIPGLLIVYLAHREVRKCAQELNRIERRAREGGAS